jgi:predicted Zn-dependent protease with MMP-like domain
LSADQTFDTDVLDDDAVPLARSIAADPSGGRATIVMYRRPLEARALDDEDLEDLLHDAVIDRLAHLLGRDPDELDPHS